MQAYAVSILWVNLCADAKNAQDIAAIHEMGTIFSIRRVDKDRIRSGRGKAALHLSGLRLPRPAEPPVAAALAT